jgi:hypothetical protein
MVNIPVICDKNIDAMTSSLCTNPEQSSSPQTLPDELSMKQQLTKLEIMCVQIQDENEKFICETSQHKETEIRQVLKLGEEADESLSSVKDYHEVEQCYLHTLNILPQHVKSLCNYDHLLQTDKKELDRTDEFLDKTEELFKKVLQVEPNRSPTLFNYDGYLHKCERV